MRKTLVQKTFGAFRAPSVPFPDLVGHQRSSFDWLLKDGLTELFKEFSPISDYSKKKFDLEFTGFELTPPRYDEHFARENKLSYETPLRTRVKLITDPEKLIINRIVSEIKGPVSKNSDNAMNLFYSKYF